MDQNEQIQHLRNELAAVVHRFRREYDLPFAAAFGTVMLYAMELRDEQYRLVAEQEKPEDDDTEAFSS